MFEEIQNHRNVVRDNVLKGFNPDLGTAIEENALFNKGEIEYDELQKAVYADTAENRKLGRVGQEYHRGKGKKEEPSTAKKQKEDKADSFMSSLSDEDKKTFSEYKKMREKHVTLLRNGGKGLQGEEWERYGKLEKEVDRIEREYSEKSKNKEKPTSSSSRQESREEMQRSYEAIDNRLTDVTMKIFRLRNEGKSDSAEFKKLKDESNRLESERQRLWYELRKKPKNKEEKTPDFFEDLSEYPSREDQEEIERMMEDDGLDPEKQSNKKYGQYYARLLHDNNGEEIQKLRKLINNSNKNKVKKQLTEFFDEQEYDDPKGTADIYIKAATM